MDQKYIITCPNCNVEKILYTTLKGMEYGKKHNIICKKCKEKIKNNIIYERNCPSCGKTICTKNKYWNDIAVKNNKKCAKCVGQNRQFTKHHCKMLRLNHANVDGIRNPFYGKHHTKETKERLRKINAGIDRFSHIYKEKLRKRMIGCRNPFFGKHHTNEVKKLLSKPKSLDHRIKLSLALKGKHRGNVIPISDETRRKMRISAIKRIRRNKYKNPLHICPNVNKNECKFFTKLEKDRGWNGIFYLKDGKKQQYLIEDLGYFVDYYEPKLNIVVEYDETRHYNSDWTLKEKDVKRQNEIINRLNCKFFRYIEPLDKFYEIK